MSPTTRVRAREVRRQVAYLETWMTTNGGISAEMLGPAIARAGARNRHRATYSDEDATRLDRELEAAVDSVRSAHGL